MTYFVVVDIQIQPNPPPRPIPPPPTHIGNRFFDFQKSLGEPRGKAPTAYRVEVFGPGGYCVVLGRGGKE